MHPRLLDALQLPSTFEFLVLGVEDCALCVEACALSSELIKRRFKNLARLLYSGHTTVELPKF